MWEVIKTNVLLPSLGRVGSAATGYLVAIGANQQHADWVGVGLVGAILIAVDLAGSRLIRKVNEDKAAGKAFNKFLSERDYRGIGGGQ